MKILAIDPGYERLGIAVVLSDERGKCSLLHSSCFQTSAKLPHYKRLLLVGEEIRKIIETWKPNSVAIEELFFGNNHKTAMLVSEALGVILYESARAELRTFQYTPLQVKIAITGYGRASKDQIMTMLPKLISIRKTGAFDDEYDAIAVALTHAASYKMQKIA